MRTIGVVTVGRSDYGLLRPVLRRIAAETALELMLIVSGAHLPDSTGGTVRWIETDGFSIAERVEMLLASDSPEAVAKSVGLGIIGFASVFARVRPDMVLLLGDRFEMHAAALAALPFGLPVAHIHGGELTLGAFDDSLRHSITKLSHLHFVAHPEYGRRVLQLGEEPWRIVVSGAPGVDGIRETGVLSQEEFRAKFGFDLPRRFALATFHPVTLEAAHTEWQCHEWLAALEASGLEIVFTQPNADPGSAVLQRLIRNFTRAHSNARLVPDLGPAGYYTAMKAASVMVGNSSSGLLEAPSFAVPVVNIGTRQTGRLRAGNVIDTDYSREAVLAGIRRALSTEFRESLVGLRNPCDCGDAAATIVDTLRTVVIDGRLLQKRFYDYHDGRIAASPNPA